MKSIPICVCSFLVLQALIGLLFWYQFSFHLPPELCFFSFFLFFFLFRCTAARRLGNECFCWAFFTWPANMPAALTDSSQIICEVWASNVEDEMRKIRQIIQSYNYIAMVSLWRDGLISLSNVFTQLNLRWILWYSLFFNLVAVVLQMTFVSRYLPYWYLFFLLPFIYF